MPGTVTVARARVAPSIMQKEEQVAPVNQYFCRAMVQASEQLLFSYMRVVALRVPMQAHVEGAIGCIKQYSQTCYLKKGKNQCCRTVDEQAS